MSHVAVITGASRGLGLALARELAARGWSLILDARGAEALSAVQAELASFTQVVAVPGDIANPAHRAKIAETARQFGGVDAVVHNASALGPSPRPELLDFPIDALESVFQVNVVAPLALTQELWPFLRSTGSLMAVSSDAGVEAYAGWGGYGASKAALEHMFAILAAEQPDRRVYWVDPGDMRTQMHQEAFPGEDISDRPLPEESVPGLLALIEGNLPSGRYAARALAGKHQEAVV